MENTAGARAFLEALWPQIMGMSAGSGNWYGHPDEEVLQRATNVGAAVLRTDEVGTIELMTDGKGLWWHAGR